MHVVILAEDDKDQDYNGDVGDEADEQGENSQQVADKLRMQYDIGQDPSDFERNLLDENEYDDQF